MALQWTKTRAEWSATTRPLSAKIQPKGDGRWDWQVFKDGQGNPMATGIADSVGAAKTVVEQLVNRSGLV